MIAPFSDAASPKRRWRVYCSQFVSCRWSGYRRAVTREEAIAKPCPRCEKGVVA